MERTTVLIRISPKVGLEIKAWVHLGRHPEAGVRESERGRGELRTVPCFLVTHWVTGMERRHGLCLCGIPLEGGGLVHVSTDCGPPLLEVCPWEN